MRQRHHHGYICTQFRHRSWFTRRCAHPSCGIVALTTPARLLLAAALALAALAVVGIVL